MWRNFQNCWADLNGREIIYCGLHSFCGRQTSVWNFYALILRLPINFVVGTHIVMFDSHEMNVENALKAEIFRPQNANCKFSLCLRNSINSPLSFNIDALFGYHANMIFTLCVYDSLPLYALSWIMKTKKDVEDFNHHHFAGFQKKKYFIYVEIKLT